MNWFKREKGGQWPNYRIASEAPDKWRVQEIGGGHWFYVSGGHTLEEAKKICLHLSQGPFYPPFNPDHS